MVGNVKPYYFRWVSNHYNVDLGTYISLESFKNIRGEF